MEKNPYFLQINIAVTTVSILRHINIRNKGIIFYRNLQVSCVDPLMSHLIILEYFVITLTWKWLHSKCHLNLKQFWIPFKTWILQVSCVDPFMSHLIILENFVTTTTWKWLNSKCHLNLKQFWMHFQDLNLVSLLCGSLHVTSFNP